MVSDWLPSRTAIELLRAGGEQNPEERLRRALTEAELCARAGVVRALRLSSIAVGKHRREALQDQVYYLEGDRYLDLRKDLKALPDGRHHLCIRGDHYTVVINDANISIFWGASSGERDLNPDLKPAMWEWADIDFKAGTAVSDDIDGAIRTRVSQIEFSRGGVERLLPAQHRVSPRAKKLGRPPKYDLPKEESFVRSYLRTNPDARQSTVVDILLNHLGAVNPEAAPSVSTVKKWLSPLFKELSKSRR